MQNVFTLFRNDVKLSFVKMTKFIVQFSQTFSFQCRGLFKPYFRREKPSIYAIFNAFPGPQKLSLTHSANKYIYKIFRREKHRYSGRINYIFRCGSLESFRHWERQRKRKTKKKEAKKKKK